MTATALIFTCSNKPRVISPRHRNHQPWKREAYHAAENGKTLCGRNATDWLAMDGKSVADALADTNLCTRCAEKLKLRSN